MNRNNVNKDKRDEKIDNVNASALDMNPGVEYDPVIDVLDNKDLTGFLFRFFDLPTLRDASLVNRKWHSIAAPKLDKLKYIIEQLIFLGVDLQQIHIPEPLAEEFPVDVEILYEQIKMLHPSHITPMFNYFPEEELNEALNYMVLHGLISGEAFKAAFSYLDPVYLKKPEFAQQILLASAFASDVDTFKSLLSEELNAQIAEPWSVLSQQSIDQACKGGNWSVLQYIISQLESSAGDQLAREDFNVYSYACTRSMYNRQAVLTEKIIAQYGQHLNFEALEGSPDEALERAVIGSDIVENVKNYLDLEDLGVESCLRISIETDAVNVFKFLVEKFHLNINGSGQAPLYDDAISSFSFRILFYILEHPDCNLGLSFDPSVKHIQTDQLVRFVENVNQSCNDVNMPSIFRNMLDLVIKKCRLKLDCVDINNNSSSDDVSYDDGPDSMYRLETCAMS